jgi:hypothetical protein
VLLVNYRLPETLPSNKRDFPARDITERYHARDSRFLLLMVAGYLLALSGGIALLGMLTPVTHSPIVTAADANGGTSTR